MRTDLSSSEEGITMPGTIVHYELPASDADRAAGFWSGLFGWGFSDSGMPGMDYRMADAGDGQGVAVYPAPDDAGTGPIVYFGTDDIEQSIAKIRDLGGEAENKMPVPGHGWFAPCRDTEGNRFRLWQQDGSATMPS
jgi:predicted enzyme related to lactoylglutathione lyase